MVYNNSSPQWPSNGNGNAFVLPVKHSTRDTNLVITVRLLCLVVCCLNSQVCRGSAASLCFWKQLGSSFACVGCCAAGCVISQ